MLLNGTPVSHAALMITDPLQKQRSDDFNNLWKIETIGLVEWSSNIMPPRLPALTAFCQAAPVTSTAFAAFLVPFMQNRNASILSALSDTPGAYNKRIRRGRGPSSGKGKTSRRGHKGQKQHGKMPARFQGGQTPQEIVHGKRGVENQYASKVRE